MFCFWYRTSYFQVQGQLYHLTVLLLPPDMSNPKFLQIYLSDNTNQSQSQTRAILAGNIGLRVHLLERFGQWLHQHNPYVPLFKTTGEQLNALPTEPTNVCLFTVQPHERDPQPYNKTQAPEVGMIMGGGNTKSRGETGGRNLVLQHQDSSLHQISETVMSRSIDSDKSYMPADNNDQEV